MNAALTPENALRIYRGSNGEETVAFYRALEALGPAGIVATNLFRAQKCSTRAKVYRRRAHKNEAYGRKQWSMDNLCRVLVEHAQVLGIRFGWQRDPSQPLHAWVLYVDVPGGQVSFHTAERGQGPDYQGEWDRGNSEAAMLAHVCYVITNALQAQPAAL